MAKTKGLTELDKEHIVWRCEIGMRQFIAARLYGVSRQRIWQIVEEDRNKKLWRRIKRLITSLWRRKDD